ncbi:MAG TPA: outer membrane protein assembly factor BamD [Acidiphilium sp.]|uniref:outer membrane protein assembly factor BamD n=1 Tax=unclassified Acidiphilium TaxID=2617493 RepID=UPI0025BB5D9C|nr:MULTISPECIES: outer membrane protein assembly factor BamD [unclassified Acidiphilium]HQT60536.1 outer membrane protein assembly factor BamD [Acidiphilium sp.]HQU11990.1 outer membrane protein assembly factor BamD [Acidiphilium sp.]
MTHSQTPARPARLTPSQPRTRRRRPRALPALLLLSPLALGGCGLFGGSAKTGADAAAHKHAAKPLQPADALYAEGIAQLHKGENKKAAQLFGEIEVNYPYSTWASHAELLQGYAQYRRQNFDSAVSALNRFIELHPASPEAAYAYYLKALCFYEQIEDVQRDQTFTLEAAQALQDVVSRFPDSAYARDARIKLRLVENRLAGHQMEIGRFYQRQNLYAAAISRYQVVVQQYQTTTFAPEALDRLVECYLDLGLVKEARRNAAVLGHNYPGSRWYLHAYDTLRRHGLVTDAAKPKATGGFLFGLL